MAPEIFGKYDNSIDIWSYGCILYVMIMGHVPFKLAKYEVSDYMRKINKIGVAELKKNLLSSIKMRNQELLNERNELECGCENNMHEECCRKL
jgi:serine/threonine protein kinase